MPGCAKCNRPVPEIQTSSACFYNMHDGRMFTDYRPRCTIDFENAGSQKTSYNARQELIHNAEKLMSESTAMAEKRAVCKKCFSVNEPGTMLPEANMQQCNDRTCTFKRDANPGGLGMGRVYS